MKDRGILLLGVFLTLLVRILDNRDHDLLGFLLLAVDHRGDFDRSGVARLQRSGLLALLRLRHLLKMSGVEPPPPEPRVAMIDRLIEVIMKRIAEMVVAFESTVADPRGPNTVCEPIPPNAPAKSAAFPLCSRTTTTKNRHTIT